MRLALQYWWRVIVRASRGSITFLGFAHPSRLAIALALFVVAVVILQAIGGKTQMEDEIRWGLATLIAAAIFFIPTFIVNMLYAPAKIDKEQREKFEKQQEKMAQNKANRAISDGLANLYNKLTDLTSEKITTAEHFATWDKQRDKWWGDVVAYIDHNISHSESALFRVASFTHKENEKVTFQNQYNEAHCNALISLGVLCEKLEKLMTRYDKAIDSSS